MIPEMMFLKSAENRETFFARIKRLFPCSDQRYILIERAYDTAKDEFKQFYRESGERYFEHLRRVTIIAIDYLYVTNYHMIAACLLHDIVEDIKSWTVEKVRLSFGEEVACLVDWLTKTDKTIYHERFINAPREFFLIKLPDRLDNLLTLWDCSPAKVRRKIKETRGHYLPFAKKHLILPHEIEKALLELEKNPQLWGVKSKR